MTFKKAEKKDLKIRLAIAGPPGSGKTYSSLLIASGIAEETGRDTKIAMIDTEMGSGCFYAGEFNYDIEEVPPPYTPARYIQSINDAASAGYNVLIIDSISHCWAGEGGVLDMHSSIAKDDPKSTFSAWRAINPHHNAFLNAILTYPGHVICTLRSKMKYEVQPTRNGKLAPVKIGAMPIQRDGILYEFTAVMEMTADNSAVCDKDRTGTFQGMTGRPTREMGNEFIRWSGKTKSAQVQALAPETVEETQEVEAQVTVPGGTMPVTEIESIIEKMESIGITEDDMIEAIGGKNLSAMDDADKGKLRTLFKERSRQAQKKLN